MKAVLLGLLFTLTLPVFANESLNSAKITPELVPLKMNSKISKIFPKAIQGLSEVEDRYILDIQLGNLSQAQFLGLKTIYGPHSKVPYDTNKSYSLIDFLPPFAQAVVNQRLANFTYNSSPLENYLRKNPDDEGSLFPIIKYGIVSFTNCWNTTIEYLRSIHPTFKGVVQLYWPGRWESDESLKSDQFGQKINAEDIKANDVLLISLWDANSESSVLQHSAVLISKTIVFEKTDTSDNDPYRLALLSDVLKKYKRILGKDLNLEYRRFNKGILKIKPAMTIKDLGSFAKSALNTSYPTLNTNNLMGGCETGSGGGCDIIFVEQMQAKVAINPKSGRGILSAPETFLKRFKGL